MKFSEATKARNGRVVGCVITIFTEPPTASKRWSDSRSKISAKTERLKTRWRKIKSRASPTSHRGSYLLCRSRTCARDYDAGPSHSVFLALRKRMYGNRRKKIKPKER